MDKEYDIKYLIGFEIEYLMNYTLYSFVVTNKSVFLSYKIHISNNLDNISDNWTVACGENLENCSTLIIEDGYLYLSNEIWIISSEFIPKLESHYTYMKRKETLKELGI